MGVVLSIMIPCIEYHKEQFDKLVHGLSEQYNGLEVEIVSDHSETDSTGTKRQRMLEKATGEYVVSIDADDEVYPYYIRELLEAAKSGADCLAINGIMTTNGANEIGWELSKNFENRTVFRNGKPFYERKANHLCAIKRELALLAGFPDISNGEDKAYSEAVNNYLKTEIKIELPMYHYKYILRNKEYLK